MNFSPTRWPRLKLQVVRFVGIYHVIIRNIPPLHPSCRLKVWSVRECVQLYCSKFHIQPLYIEMHCSDYAALNEVLHVIRINVMFKLQFSGLVTWGANWICCWCTLS